MIEGPDKLSLAQLQYPELYVVLVGEAVSQLGLTAVLWGRLGVGRVVKLDTVGPKVSPRVQAEQNFEAHS